MNGASARASTARADAIRRTARRAITSEKTASGSSTPIADTTATASSRRPWAVIVSNHPSHSWIAASAASAAIATGDRSHAASTVTANEVAMRTSKPTHAIVQFVASATDGCRVTSTRESRAASAAIR